MDARLGSVLAAARRELADSKQLVLFLMVPLVYRLASGSRGHLILDDDRIGRGRLSAAFGIFQYGILDYDSSSCGRAARSATT